MTHRIAIVSQKGGVGKTTVALNLSLALADRGGSTLLVDLDPQGGISHSLGQRDDAHGGLTDILAGRCAAENGLLPTKHEHLALLPRGELDPVDVPDYERAMTDPTLVGRVLAAVEPQFRFVLLDTPSGLGAIARAALSLADFVLVPLQAEPLALRSTEQVLRVIQAVRQYENPKLQLLGLLPTMVDRGVDASFNVMSELWNGFDVVFDTNIPRAEVFQTATLRGVPVAFLAGDPSPEARRFEVLAGEVEHLTRELTRQEDQDESRQERRLL